MLLVVVVTTMNVFNDSTGTNTIIAGLIDSTYILHSYDTEYYFSLYVRFIWAPNLNIEKLWYGNFNSVSIRLNVLPSLNVTKWNKNDVWYVHIQEKLAYSVFIYTSVTFCVSFTWFCV